MRALVNHERHHRSAEVGGFGVLFRVRSAGISAIGAACNDPSHFSPEMAPSCGWWGREATAVYVLVFSNAPERLRVSSDRNNSNVIRNKVG